MKFVNRHLIALFTVSMVIAVAFEAGRSRVSQSESPTTNSKTETPVKSDSPASNASPDLVIGRDLDRLIDESDFAQARWGVFVMSLSDGRVLYSRNGDKLFTPASNMKLYTTATALDLLGGDYRWRTSVYADKQPDAGGIIDGDLTLYGRGAPDLISKSKGDAPSLAKLANQLYQSGVREVRGNIVGDESYFRGELFGAGWQWNDLQWYFGAEPSALSIDENSVEVTIAPGAKSGAPASVVITPNENFMRLANNTTTAERAATTTVGIIRDLSSNELRVWGNFPTGGRAFSAFLSVHDPALWAAKLFKQALVARGIKVDGEERTHDFRVPDDQKFDPQKSIELSSQDSEPLGEIIRKTNKESNNLFAELILRTIGKERGATAPDPDPKKNRERGDDEAGGAVVKKWLNDHSIPINGLAIRDGSGLSRLDLVSPETTARLLVAMTKSSNAAVFHDSLPVGGRDGTLKPRLLREAGRVFAKTGTLTYDHSLSGYATTAKGETLVFSIFGNDATNHGDPTHLIDRLVELLIAHEDSRASK